MTLTTSLLSASASLSRDDLRITLLKSKLLSAGACPAEQYHAYILHIRRTWGLEIRRLDVVSSRAMAERSIYTVDGASSLGKHCQCDCIRLSETPFPQSM